jgi:hypothetical protein
LGPNILLSTLFSNTLNLCYSLRGERPSFTPIQHKPAKPMVAPETKRRFQFWAPVCNGRAITAVPNLGTCL